MVTAIVLIKTSHGHITDVADRLTSMPEVSEVYSVGGSYDLVAIIRTRDNEGIARLVTEKMVHLPGIDRTETMIAFKAYSRHDLESIFSIGAE